MLHKSDISFVVLTYNEEKHIARCIQSLKPYAKEIWVIDSFSTDKTLKIAEELGAKTVKHPFENYNPQNEMLPFHKTKCSETQNEASSL